MRGYQGQLSATPTAALGHELGEMKAPRLAGRDTCFAAVAVVRPDPPVAPEFRARNRTGDTAILPTYRLAHALAARDSGDNPTRTPNGGRK
jgi:hypothetical protein